MGVSQQEELLSTGIERLDAVLGGGLWAGDTVPVVGAPGSGKPPLAVQLAFQAAVAGRTALCVSTDSEPSSRLVKHLRDFSFWEDRLIGTRLFPGSLKLVAKMSVNLLVAAGKERGASLLIIDGFLRLRDLHRDDAAMRTFVSDLGVAVGALGCTTVLMFVFVPERRGDAPPGVTLCDAVIELYRQAGGGQGRMSDVWKMRGSANLEGEHGMRIDGDGVTLFPRMEALPLPVKEPIVQHSASFGAFGAPDLDEMTAGGLPRTSESLLAGAPGNGETLLGLQYLLDGAERGERGLWLGFRESQSALIRLKDFMASFAERAPTWGITTLLTRELGQVVDPELDFADSPLEVLAETVILLRDVELQGALARVSSILKMRDAPHDHSIRQDELGSGLGHRVPKTTQSAEGLLSGIARLPSEGRGKRDEGTGRRGALEGGDA
jgi:circadian clock protein KaiC